MKKTSIIAVLALVLMAGCSLYKEYEPRQTVDDNLYGNIGVKSVADSLSIGNRPWDMLFADTTLQSLIRKALAQNPDIRTCRNNIAQADAALTAARLAYIPSLSVPLQGSIANFAGSTLSTYQLPLSASWQVDIFGTLTSQKRQAKATVEMMRDVEQATQTQLIANVVTLYYNLLILDREIDIIDTTVVVWQRSVETLKAMMEAGLANSAAINQLQASLYGVQSQRIDLLKAIKSTENSLCLLLNETPHTIHRSTWADSRINLAKGEMLLDGKAIGIPLGLLHNRPDVRASERNLQIAYYGVQEARSNFYPKITLSGVLGWTNDGGSITVNPAQMLVNGVAQLTQPLFAQGKLRANLKISKSQCENAEIAFSTALLKAGNEVNQAYSDLQHNVQKAAIIGQQKEALYRAYSATQELMRHGTTSYLEVLTAQESYLSAQLGEVNNLFDISHSAINLYIAMGGGRTIEQ